MGTKRPFDEDLQEFIKHPKHLEYANKSELFGEDKPPLETSQNAAITDEGGAKFFNTDDDLQSENAATVPDNADKESETNASLPLAISITCGEQHAGPGALFSPNLFPDFFEFNMPRRQLVHYDDTYSSLLNCSPRKEIPVGSDHQADIPELDSDASRNRSSPRICVLPVWNPDFSNKEGETSKPHSDCKCVDSGSIRCVQQHVSEARLKLKECLGLEKFADLGLNEMGEEVAGQWTVEEEQLFHGVVYSNPASQGRRFWEQLSSAFPTRTKKQLVSYYFNVFMLRRRAVQNRSKLLEIDSDDDEWWGSKKGPFGVRVEDEDFVVGGSFEGHESSSEDVDESEVTIAVKDGSFASFEDQHKKHANEGENEQEKPSNGGLRSESYLHWDPPYSTMGSTKGVDLLPTCSMIEEIFGSSKKGESS